MTCACYKRPRPGSRRRCGGPLGLWLVLATTPAAAQVASLTSQSLFSYQASNYAGNHLAADGGLIWSNNVERTASGSSQTLLLVGLSGDTSREGTRFDYHLSTNLALLKYLGGAFPTGPTGYLDGTAVLRIVPGYISWIVRETYSQVQINLYAPVTPDNLANLNFITTGPRFMLRPTLRTSVTLDALYSYVSSSSASSQFVNIDSQRYGGDLRIERAFSEAASLYIRGHYEHVDFKDQMDNNNYSLGTAVAGYKLLDGRTVFDISGGYSKLTVYDVLTIVEGGGGGRGSVQDEKFDEPTWAVDISRLITPSQRLALSGSQQFTDAASAFRLGFDQPAPTIAPPRLANGDPFKTRQYGLSWLVQAPRTSLNISLRYVSDSYLINPANDFHSTVATALLTRQLGPVLSWDISVSGEKTQQVGTQPSSGGGQSAKTIGAFTDLRWQVGERLALRFIYAYSQQRGVYTENQIGVTASWALIGAQTQTQAPQLSPISPASTRSP